MSIPVRCRDNSVMRRYSVVAYDDGVLWIGRNNGASTPWMPAFAMTFLGADGPLSAQSRHLRLVQRL